MLPPVNCTTTRTEGARGGSGLEAVVVPVLFALFFVVGVLGNCTVLLVVTRVRRRRHDPRALRPTHMFVVNLSAADLGFLLVCVPAEASIYAAAQWLLGDFLCRFTHFCLWLTRTASVFTLVAMSADRYIAVVRPDWPWCARSRDRTRALVGLCVVWALALAAAVPAAVQQRLTAHPNAPNSSFCWESWSAHTRRVHRVATLLFGFLLPLLLICCCYCGVLWHLHRNLKLRSRTSRRSKQKTARTVLLVVCVFSVCWLPHHVISLWVEFGLFPLTDASLLFRILSHCLSYGHACTNPLLYAFMSHTYRRAARDICCRCCCCRCPRSAAAAEGQRAAPESTSQRAGAPLMDSRGAQVEGAAPAYEGGTAVFLSHTLEDCEETPSHVAAAGL